jgi:hypothetical protein
MSLESHFSWTDNELLKGISGLRIRPPLQNDHRPFSQPFRFRPANEISRVRIDVRN